MQSELVSVIVPCYNVENFIADCVSSLKAQTFKNFEAVFVNDGSTDGTLAKLKELCADVPNFKIVCRENGGLSAARNTGIKEARGEYFSFLDSDDMYRPDYLEVLLGFLKNNGLDVAVCAYKRIKENCSAQSLKPAKIKAPPKIFCDSEDAACRVLTNVNIEFAPWIKLIKRAVLEKTGLFPKVFNESVRYAEDCEFSYRCLISSAKTGVLNEPLYYYRMRKGSLCRSAFNENKLTVFNGINAVAADAANKFPRCVDYANAYAGVMAMEMLWRMHRAKYQNDGKINEMYSVLKNNMRYITSCKYHPWWRRWFSPLVPAFFKMLYGNRIKPQKSKPKG